MGVDYPAICQTHMAFPTVFVFNFHALFPAASLRCGTFETDRSPRRNISVVFIADGKFRELETDVLCKHQKLTQEEYLLLR